jgi:hypothetical protein
MSYSAVIRLQEGPIREHLSDEHLLYIAKVMADKMQAMGRRDRVSPPVSMGVWAVDDILYIGSTMQWPGSFNDHSAQLMFIAVKNGNSNSLRNDLEFANSLGDRAIGMGESTGQLPRRYLRCAEMILVRLFGEINLQYNQGHAGYYIDDQGCATYTSPSQWLGDSQYPVAVWDTKREIPLQYCVDEDDTWGCYSFIDAYFPKDMHSTYRRGKQPKAIPANQLNWEQIPNVRAAYGQDPPTIRIRAPQAPSDPSGGPSRRSTRRSILVRGSNDKGKGAVAAGAVKPKVVIPAYPCG